MRQSLTLPKLRVFLPLIFRTISLLINLSLTPMIWLTLAMVIQVCCCSVPCVQMVLRFLKFYLNSIFPSPQAQTVSALDFWNLRVLLLQILLLKFLTSPLSLELFLRTGKRLMLCRFIKRGQRMISETTDLFLCVLLLVRSWRELLPKDCSYILECMVLVAEGQHGFCQGRSCATQLATMYHDWSSILDQQPSPRIDAVFLDWSKAFDKVSHSLLLSKLHRYGICGQMLKWFTSYLYGRIQMVQYSGKFSDWITVKSGVPQGSILGPLLFNIHVLDLPSFVSSAIPQYADDTVLYRPIYSVQDEVNLQTDLDAIRTWSTINKLHLNAAKCVVMHITRSRRPIFVSYHMGDTPLETITTHKQLGIVLSSNLEWGPHVDEVTSKAKRLLGFIRRIVGSNDPATMKKLFVALVRPIIEYCAPLWTPNKESHKHKLEGV